MWTTLQIVWIRSEAAKQKLLEFGNVIKEKYKTELEELKAPYVEAILKKTPSHLYNAQMYGLQHIFFSDGWFILYCLKELVGNGRLIPPTEEQKRSLTALIISK